MTEREETLEMLVDAVRRFACEVLLPAETIVEETNEIPEHVVRGRRCDSVAGSCPRVSRPWHRTG